MPVAGKPVMDHVLDRMLADGCAELRVVTRAREARRDRARRRLAGRSVVLAYPETTAESFADGIEGLDGDDIVLLGWPDSIWEPFDGYVPAGGGGRGRRGHRARALSDRSRRPHALRRDPLRRGRRDRRDRDQARRAAVRMDLGVRRRKGARALLARRGRVARVVLRPAPRRGEHQSLLSGSQTTGSTSARTTRSRGSPIRASSSTTRRRSSVHTIFVDSTLDDATRRERLYDGDLFLYSPRPSTLALTEHGREMADEAFGSLDPETAQFEMPVEEYAALLAELKPKFIHHPDSKRLIQEMLIDLGCDPERRLLRRAAHADVDVGRVPHVGHRVRLPPAPRHLVLGAAVPAQLVAADLPDRVGERHGVPSALLVHAGAATARAPTTTQSGTRRRAKTRRSTSRRTRACSPSPRRTSSSIRRSGRSSSPAASCCSRRRSCTRAFRTRRARRASASTSARCTSTTSRSHGGAPNIDSRVHRHDDGRLPAGERPRARARRAHRGVRHPDAGDGLEIGRPPVASAGGRPSRRESRSRRDRPVPIGTGRARACSSSRRSTAARACP